MSEEEILIHNQNWYRKVYFQIIDRARLRGLDKNKIDFYVEIHHILPKCLGGTDENDNLVALTYREHIVCHKLLCKLYPDNYYLHSSIYLMLHIKIENGKKVKTFSNSKEAEEYKLFLKTHKKPLSEESRKKMSESHKGWSPSEEQVEKAKQTRILHGGWVHTDESKRKISESLKKTNSVSEHISEDIRNSLRKKFGFAVRYTDINTGEIYEFDSITKAVSELKELSIMNKSFHFIKRSCTLNINGFEFINETNEMIQKKVQGPDGIIYNSISECARQLNTVRFVIIDWITNHPEKGFKYI